MTKNEQSTNETVGLIFGRFNPPHKGHRAAWKIASKETHWYVGTNQTTQGPKDPLPYRVKLKCMEALWPEVSKHVIASQSWLTLASELYQKHPDSDLVLCSDEDWVFKVVKKYNGVKGPHGFYNFSCIKTNVTPRLSSASKLRQAVIDNNCEKFQEAAGISEDTQIQYNGKAIDFFELVKKYIDSYREKILD